MTDHSITFDELRDGSWDATCRCGWESTGHEDRDGAESAAEEHERNPEEEQ